jgi:hypothetical protein
VAQNAIDFLGRADPSRRTLIQLGFKHPHYNLICPDRFYAQYDPARIRWPDIAHADDYHGPQPGFAVYEAAYIANGQWTPEKAGDEAWRQVVRAYFAACSHVDHEIGRFLDALDASPFGRDERRLPLGQRLQPRQPRQFPQDEPVGQRRPCAARDPPRRADEGRARSTFPSRSTTCPRR